MLIDGAIIMVIGTGTVFAFLGVLVCMIYLLTFLVKHFPTENTTMIAASAERSKLSRDNLRAEEIAVAIAAVTAFSEGRQ